MSLSWDLCERTGEAPWAITTIYTGSYQECLDEAYERQALYYAERRPNDDGEGFHLVFIEPWEVTEDNPRCPRLRGDKHHPQRTARLLILPAGMVRLPESPRRAMRSHHFA